MTSLLRIAALAALLLPAAACGEGADLAAEWTNADGREPPAEGDDRLAIHTREAKVKLGLTDEVVYFRLSDELLAEVDADMRRETEGQSGLGATIASAVTQGVSSALRDRMQYRVDEIRDVRYEDGRLSFEFEEPGRRAPDLEVNGEPVGTRFAPEDARRFVEEFRAVKGGR